MRDWLKQLDRVLRGEATSLTALKEGTLHVSVGGLSVVLTMLAASYGLCMGFYSLFSVEHGQGWKQMASGTVKMPALFILTLLVTFPSLYVFNALVGSKLTLDALGRLMVAAMSVLLAVLASFGTIVAFFSVTTASHPFILLLNVAACALAGFLGMGFLLQTLHRMSLVMNGQALAATHGIEPGVGGGAKPQAMAGASGGQAAGATAGDATAGPPPGSPPGLLPGSTQGSPPAPPAGSPPGPLPEVVGEDVGGGPVEEYIRKLVAGRSSQTAGTAPPPPTPGSPGTPDKGALDRVPGSVFSPHVKTVFVFWVILFALVGAQMSWVLRPLIGKPDQAFQYFEPRGSNFFAEVWNTFWQLLGGRG